ncbi:MAG TPA: hypothetical protein PKW90_14035, partial [Myxococcota bacterium]|nr:hypothetical protein [Myxococcota bacterium]
VDVNTTLNLNCRNLKHNRSLVFGEIVTKLGNADLTELKRQLSHWDARDQQGYRQEYAGVATFILRHAIKLRTQKAARLRKKPAS